MIHYPVTTLVTGTRCTSVALSRNVKFGGTKKFHNILLKMPLSYVYRSWQFFCVDGITIDTASVKKVKAHLHVSGLSCNCNLDSGEILFLVLLKCVNEELCSQSA